MQHVLAKHKIIAKKWVLITLNIIARNLTYGIVFKSNKSNVMYQNGEKITISNSPQPIPNLAKTYLLLNITLFHTIDLNFLTQINNYQ